MKPKWRPYQTEDDFWRIREFLRQIFLLNGRREFSWHIARLDYWRWHGVANITHDALEQSIFIWETEAREIAAVLNRESHGEAFLQTHPALRSLVLDEEMIRVAEQHLAHVDANGQRALTVWTIADDEARVNVLKQLGYRQEGAPEFQWRRELDAPVADVPLAPGYVVRALGDGAELLERCYASGLAFHPGDIQYAIRNRDDVTWYRNIQTAPLYRRDLDLVAIAPDGAVASFTTIWFDDVTRSAMFEPVATVPAHQRRGLARAVITEGLRRLQRMGATIAFVGGYSQAANALYSSTLSPAHDVYEPWVKTW